MATKDWEVGASTSMELVFMPITRSIDLRVRSWMPPTSLFFSWDLQGVVLGVGLEHFLWERERLWRRLYYLLACVSM